jgi:hypothetical protein
LTDLAPIQHYDIALDRPRTEPDLVAIATPRPCAARGGWLNVAIRPRALREFERLGDHRLRDLVGEEAAHGTAADRLGGAHRRLLMSAHVSSSISATHGRHCWFWANATS